MKMEQAKAQKTEEQKKAEVNGGCAATVLGLAMLGGVVYSIYLVGQINGWW